MVDQSQNSLFEVVHERSVKTVAKVLDGRLVVAQDDRRLVVGQLTLGLCVAINRHR